MHIIPKNNVWIFFGGNLHKIPYILVPQTLEKGKQKT